MDKVADIFRGFSEFIQLFIIKYQYENIGLVKKMKIDSRLNLEIEDKRWCKLFLHKSCYNHCAKFIMIKRLEDKGYIYPKINSLGRRKWEDFIKNISKDLDILYFLVIKDLQADSNAAIRNCFKDSDYDIFNIDDELASHLIKYFEPYDFSNLDVDEIKKLFELIYPLEQREDYALSNFYKEAPAFDYLLKEGFQL